jgi:hypothetical protein
MGTDIAKFSTGSTSHGDYYHTRYCMLDNEIKGKLAIQQQSHTVYR